MEYLDIQQSIDEYPDLFSIQDKYFEDEELSFANEINNIESMPNQTVTYTDQIPKKRKNPKFCQHYRWTQYEDDILRQLVKEFGENDWRHLAKKIDGRNSRQCRERWQYYLSPQLKVGNWTKEEDELIFKKYQELGPKWMTIKKFFINRTDAMIKNRYRALIKNGNMISGMQMNINQSTQIASPQEINQTKIIEKTEQFDYIGYFNFNENNEDYCEIFNDDVLSI